MPRWTPYHGVWNGRSSPDRNRPLGCVAGRGQPGSHFWPGTIDGNKDNQLDVRPTALTGAGFRLQLSIGGDGGEEIRAACGIAWNGGRVQGLRTAADNTGFSLGPSENLEANPPPLLRVELRSIAVAGCATGIRVHGQMEETRIADFRFSDNERDAVMDPHFGGGFIREKSAMKG